MRRLTLMFAEARESVFNSWGLFVLRLGVGLTMLLAHGSGKLFGFSEYVTKFADPFGLGMSTSLALTVFAEFFCSILLIVGLFTRLATIPLIITMLTAFFIIHGDDPFMRKEKALLFLIPYVTILLSGPGRISLDWLLGRKAPAPEKISEPMA